MFIHTLTRARVHTHTHTHVHTHIYTHINNAECIKLVYFNKVIFTQK